VCNRQTKASFAIGRPGSDPGRDDLRRWPTGDSRSASRIPALHRAVSCQRHTAVDMQLDPIDESTCLACKKEGGTCQFFRMSQTACRNERCHMLLEGGTVGIRDPEFSEYGGVGRPGAQHVDADVARFELYRPVFRKGRDRSLGAGIKCMARQDLGGSE